ncbi:hypothetical protein AGABI1DRAFT_103047 [Agaricus bisporus var. burnettii JB137-S8]|uniref:NAD(P)-binding domain-containing protein n=1 Tax=Agaricus bisporus var. burnettii (strain JB137-S8 / ATCC MYA-4627 / FGSC 10392) TaxID=597362 RepID=K5WJ27_AGABU|nr:uncharacterized protein AGABI1DRAFT_103047 [Agaricus bisporus var. burnettii JB137-S8]EKM75291.1 hypothetical protein AGABI1DRAFT_103047 [Agaricus bisporus var. burnettii JB137-S8]
MSNTTTSRVNVLAIGASRNIGYYATLKLLRLGATVTYLLRNPSVFDNDANIQPFLSTKKARIVKGDALVKNDVARTWSEATSDSKPVNYLLFTLGGKPTVSLSKGIAMDNPNICSLAILNVLCTIPQNHPPPKILAISSTGFTPDSHSHLPFALKPLYSFVLAKPRADKLAMERVLHYVTEGLYWDPAKNGEPPVDILPSEWRSTEGLPAEGSLKGVVVLRPSLLTDGKSLAEEYEGKDRKDKKPYKVSTEEIGGYTVSRRDVAHFVVDLVTQRWNEFENKVVNITY